MKKLFTLLMLASMMVVNSNGQCGPNESTIVVSINTDNWGYETSWTIADDSGTIYAQAAAGSLLNNTSYDDTVCVPAGVCLSFQIQDTYGDGITGTGGFALSVSNVVVSEGNAFGYGTNVHLNCAPGTFCSTAIPLDGYGTYSGEFDNSWFVYTATETGTFNFSTCNLNTCDTRIYIYDVCNQDYLDEGPPGTYTYNDDSDCGAQADLNVVFNSGETYYIRIGDAADACTDAINFTFNYVGPVQGCTDATACNYNPMAGLDDGSCIYFPSPLCTGPDLRFDSLEFVNTLYLMTRTTQACDVEEGCVLGYGTRYVLTFSSKIDNVGDIDYYIGTPSANPQMFNTQNCHGHTHYNAYGDYRLYDMAGNMIPAGHKNGFCVMDLCGFGQYTCGNMGISSGCYDRYGAGTQCQWVDLTDIPTGDYRLMIVVNPFHLEDALGHHETNYSNNATQVCIHVEHNEGAAPTWSVLPDCNVFVDCLGNPNGTAVMDCNGECNGNALWGDVHDDNAINAQDTDMYMSMLANQSAEVTPCNDLSGDGHLSVYDAALMQWCHHSAPVMGPDGVMHQICSFPRNVINDSQYAGLAISSFNADEHYIDVEITSPDANIMAYQFGVTGITISSVQSLVDATEFPAQTEFNAFTNQVICISPLDSTIERQAAPRSLVRIYYSDITASTICIEPIIDLVRIGGERVQPYIYGNCATTIGVNVLGNEMGAHMVVQPNPVNTNARLIFGGTKELPRFITIHDQAGRVVKTVAVNADMSNSMNIELSDLANGVYTITALQNETAVMSARFVKL
jgi:hypothetical protein